MTTQCSLEKLEPRWAPARLIAGPLPAQFGADLSALAAEVEEATESLAYLLPEAGTLASQVTFDLARRDLGAAMTLTYILPGDLSVAARIRFVLPPVSVLETEVEGEDGGTPSEPTNGVLGGTLSLGSYNGGVNYTSGASFAAVIKTGAGTLNLSNATLAGSITLVSGSFDFSRLHSADYSLIARPDTLGDLQIANLGSSGAISSAGTADLTSSALGAFLRFRGGTLTTTMPPELIPALLAEGVIPPVPAEAAEQAPETYNDAFLGISENPIDPPQ